MKRYIIYFAILLTSFEGAAVELRSDSDPNVVIENMLREINMTNQRYSVLLDEKDYELQSINKQLIDAHTMEQQVHLLIIKDRLSSEIQKLQADSNFEISKIRYLKGLQIIKILYEKVLSLDHHFASVRSRSDINKMSNPNQYPEYGKLKEVLAAKKDKKFAVELTSMLGANTVVAVVQTLTNLVGSTLTREEKTAEIRKVECILDFTLRMQNDLNTIYFETAFLQSNNEKIKAEIELLFRDYTKPIGYDSPLEQCRRTDDWETVTTKMDDYLMRVKTASGSGQYKLKVNIEFPIDRLLQFISQYNNFIDQGGKFYEKFKIILNSYENEKQCETKLPVEYVKLKADIDSAIQKFNVAYKPVEINGSKMKEILYGLNEFE